MVTSHHILTFLFSFMLFSSCYTEENKTNETLKTVEDSLSYQIEGGITVLTPQNFENAYKDFELLMVEFYSPMCGHCKDLEPHYTEAAKFFEKDDKIKLAKISCSKYPKFTEPFNVTHYPTLNVYYKGVFVVEYHGPRTKGPIIDFLKAVKKVLAYPIETMEQIDIVRKEFITSLIYFGDNAEDLKAFNDYPAKMMKNTCNNKDLMNKLNVKPRTVVFFKEFDELRNDLVIEKELTDSMIDAHLEKYGTPFLEVFKYDIYLNIFAYDIPGVILYENSDNEAECKKYELILTEAARKIKSQAKDPKISKKKKETIEKMIFTKMNGKAGDMEQKAFKEMKFKKNEKLPLLKLHNEEKKKAYKFDEEFTVDEIVKFVNQFLNGQLIPVDFGDL